MTGTSPTSDRPVSGLSLALKSPKVDRRDGGLGNPSGFTAAPAAPIITGKKGASSKENDSRLLRSKTPSPPPPQMAIYSSSVPNSLLMGGNPKSISHYSAVKRKYFASLNVTPSPQQQANQPHFLSQIPQQATPNQNTAAQPARRASNPPVYTSGFKTNARSDEEKEDELFKMDEGSEHKSGGSTPIDVTPSSTPPLFDSTDGMGSVAKSAPTTVPLAIPSSFSEDDEREGGFIPPHLLLGQEGFSVVQWREKKKQNPLV